MGLFSRFKKKPVSVDYFNEAVETIFKHEGGYVNIPSDPGGETKYGISKRQYPSIDILNLTKDQAKRIYRNDYWNACSCGSMPQTIALAVFDSAVNQGVRAASRMIQTAAHVKADGVIGPKTLAAINKRNPEQLLEWFMTERILRYTSTQNFAVFGRGWIRRTLSVMREAPKDEESVQ